MASKATKSTKPTRSVSDIESDLAAARTRLGGTVDQLAFRAKPQEIARRQVSSTKLKFAEATHTPDGDLRTERVGMALLALAAGLIVMGLLRRRNS